MTEGSNTPKIEVPADFPLPKEVDTTTLLLEEIRKRWSCRSFSEKLVEPEKITALFEAARWSPSSMNEQPWHYIYATRDDKEHFSLLGELMYPGNHQWAIKAPLLVLALARTTIVSTGDVNRHAWYDTGLANMALTLQAMHMELYMHQIGGFDAARARHTYQLPEYMEPVVMMAIGYRGEPEKLDEPFYTRELAPRKRKELHEFIFKGGYNGI